MIKFKTVIKNYPTNKLILELADLAWAIFKGSQKYLKLETKYHQSGKVYDNTCMLFPWDIAKIQYSSVKHSNDFRSQGKYSLDDVIVAYRIEEKNEMDDSLSEFAWLSLLGYTSDQFMFQSCYLLFGKINRDYHIIFKIGKKNYNEDVFFNLFGFSAEHFYQILAYLFHLAFNKVNVFNKEILKENNNGLFTIEDVIKVIEYYSTSYDNLIESKLGYQVLYTKPYILCDKDETYYLSSIYALLFSWSNSFYWFIRERFKNEGNKKFISEMGVNFEKYVFELFSVYIDTKRWEKLPEGENKQADILFSYKKFNFFIEIKSSLMSLNAKKINPDVGSINLLIKRAIDKAYKQLNSSCINYSIDNSFNIKIILLYDEFSATNFIEACVPDIFTTDLSCFVCTITELEWLLHAFKYRPQLFEKFTVHLVKGINSKKRMNIGSLLNELKINEFDYFAGDRDYFISLLKQLDECKDAQNN